MTNPTSSTNYVTSTTSGTRAYSSTPRYQVDPIAEYARILYEHTRQQMDLAAQQQEEKATAQDNYPSRQHAESNRATARV